MQITNFKNGHRVGSYNFPKITPRGTAIMSATINRPTVTTNGTSTGELREAHCAVHALIDGMRDAIRASAPNGRDYPTQSDYQDARDQWAQNLNWLAVLEEQTIRTIEHIDAQVHPK